VVDGWGDVGNFWVRLVFFLFWGDLVSVHTVERDCSDVGYTMEKQRIVVVE
jgi:hypothetical protein